jgi:transcriptional regulator with XRE-family HTH domain
MISDDLRRAIEKSGQSQLQIAKATGVSQPVINRFVRRERGISFDAAERLAAYLRLRLR